MAAFPHCYGERRDLRRRDRRSACTSTATYRLEADNDLLVLLCPDHLIAGLVDMLVDGLASVSVSLV